MNLDKIYNDLPKDLIDYDKFIELFNDLDNKQIKDDKKLEIIIRNRIFKLIINSKYKIDLINYLIDTDLKINDINFVNGFFNKIDSLIDYDTCNISIDDIIKILNSNPKFYELAKIYYNTNKNKINSIGLSKITVNNFLKMTIQGYLVINDIELEEENFDEIDSSDYTVDTFGQYISEIRKYPRLTNNEETELLNKAQNGDQDAKNKFIECNLRLVAYIVYKKYSRRSLPMMDLIEEGNIGLIRAIEKYNADLGIKFSRYASYWIECFINKALYTQTRNIVLPSYMFYRINSYKKHYSDLEEKLKRKPTNEEMMKVTGFNKENILLINQYLFDTISENEELKTNKSDENSDQSLLDCIQDQNFDIEEKIINKNEYDILNYVLNCTNLSEKEKDVIKRRNGYYGKIEKLEEIGKTYNLSKERIRQIEAKALRKLKKELIKTKYNGINSYKLKPLYSFFPNVDHSHIDYIVEHLSEEYKLFLSNIYHNNYNLSLEVLLNNKDISLLIEKIIPKIKELLIMVYVEKRKEIELETINNLMHIIKIYDIKNAFSSISNSALIIGLLKDGYIDNYRYNIKSISQLLSMDIFETYEEYLEFTEFMNTKGELSNILKNRIKIYKLTI